MIDFLLPENAEDKKIRTLLLFLAGMLSKLPLIIDINLSSSILVYLKANKTKDF